MLTTQVSFKVNINKQRNIHMRTQCGFTVILFYFEIWYNGFNQVEDVYGMILLIWISMLKLVGDIFQAELEA